MKVLELRPYVAGTDIPKTGWDAMSVNDALADGKALFVDQFGDVWTYVRHECEYVGKIL